MTPSALGTVSSAEVVEGGKWGSFYTRMVSKTSLEIQAPLTLSVIPTHRPWIALEKPLIMPWLVHSLLQTDEPKDQASFQLQKRYISEI